MSLSIFLPITKVDAAQRLVYGVFTEEVGDRSREIMDYASSKPNFEKWSEDLYGASGGKNYGNIRAMHKNVAAGMLSEPINFDDTGKQMYGCARIVDNDEWAKVEAGVYTGFSVGGRYGKRWTDPENPTLIRYEAFPSEISLVDLPCVKGATFQLIKAEGGGAITEEKAFTNTLPEGEQAPPALTITKSEEGKEGDQDPKGTEAHKVEVTAVNANSNADLEQVWKAKDGQTFAKKADAIKHNQELETRADVEKHTRPIEASLVKLDALLGGSDPSKAGGNGDAGGSNNGSDPDSNVNNVGGTVSKTGKTTEEISTKLQKDLYDVGRVASILGELRWIRQSILVEQALEGDQGSTLPEGICKACDALCSFLVAMVNEEVSEIMSDTDVQLSAGEGITIITNAAGLLDGSLRKALIAHKGDDDKTLNEEFRKILETAEALNKNVKVTAVNKDAAADDLNKALMVLKDEDLLVDNENLPLVVRKLLAKNLGLETELGKLGTTIDQLVTRVEKLASQPEPPKGVLRVITKTADSSFATNGTAAVTDDPTKLAAAYQEHLSKLSPDQKARELIKLSLANPVAQWN